MIYLFVHQNFPGQYLHLVRHLARQPGNRVYFITQSAQGELPGVRKLVYHADLRAAPLCHTYAAELDRAVRTGSAVAAVCKQLRRRGIFPDLVIGHCGWGETLFIKDVFPRTPVLSNFEFFFHAEGADVGFDREFSPRRADDGGRLRVRNALNHMSAEASDWGHTATQWQHGLFPADLQRRITVLHEGTDTDRYRPDPRAKVELSASGMRLTADAEVVTYVSRNLEPYRGFHTFMRALPALLERRPRAHVLILGGDGVSYGAAPPAGRCHREVMLAEMAGRIDPQRVHFLGTVHADMYRRVLQISSCHVYLTYPWILSWSCVEAMACGCLVVGSATAPVQEFLQDGRNGVLTDFFDPAALADTVADVLEFPQRFAGQRAAARRTIVDALDFRSVILPRWLRLLDDLTAGREPAAPAARRRGRPRAATRSQLNA